MHAPAAYRVSPLTFQREVRHVTSQAPHFNGAVQRGRGENIRVLEVELDHHHVVGVALEDLGTVPILIPVEKLDRHVVRGRQDVGQRRVDFHVAGERRKRCGQGMRLVRRWTGLQSEHALDRQRSLRGDPSHGAC